MARLCLHWPMNQLWNRSYVALVEQALDICARKRGLHLRYANTLGNRWILWLPSGLEMKAGTALVNQRRWSLIPRDSKTRPLSRPRWNAWEFCVPGLPTLWTWRKLWEREGESRLKTIETEWRLSCRCYWLVVVNYFSLKGRWHVAAVFWDFCFPLSSQAAGWASAAATRPCDMHDGGSSNGWSYVELWKRFGGFGVLGC